MARGSILFAALLGGGIAQRSTTGCDDCNIDLSALEEFTSDYDVVIASVEEDSPDFTTMSLPPNMPSDRGTVAVHARHVQLKLDNHFAIPADFQFPSDRGTPAERAILQQFVGHEIHEELHINGIHGQASFHLGSPVLNMCIQVDVPPPPPIPHDMMDARLQQAQQVASMQFHGMGMHVTVDGVESITTIFPNREIFAVTTESHPELVSIGPFRPGRPNPAFKFSNYVNSVGDAFATRACEVETHSATQTMLAGNPEVRDFVAGRLAEHQARLRALLEPKTLNTRFNFIPLEIVDLMMPPVGEGCANDVLAQTAPMEGSTFQIVVLAVCSFAMGVAATYGAMRKKAVPSAEVGLLSE